MTLVEGSPPPTSRRGLVFTPISQDVDVGKVCTSILINAPKMVVFNLARSLNAHTETTGQTKERIVDGPDHDLLELGDVVTFEAVHFGVKQRLTSKIVEMDPPNYFIDEMQKGAFKRLRHIHRFRESNGATEMTDELEFESPLGWIGKMVDRLLLERYMRRFIGQKSQDLKRLAESSK